jgi:hypothetical protein
LTTTPPPAPLRALLVCGGRFHDFDFARLELLKLLAEDDRVRVRTREDYRDLGALAEADFLVTYTCDVRPTHAEQAALREFVNDGGRWFALHGSNSIFELRGRDVETPRTHALLMQTLGSRFLAHPPVGRYRVTVTDRSDPLVAGIDSFETEDELYLCEMTGAVRLLLETRFGGKTPGFTPEEWRDDEPRPVMYLHPVGTGEVLYLTLGHCRGPFDMRPLVAVYPRVERCSWELPVFHELLRRGIAWAKPAPALGA